MNVVDGFQNTIDRKGYVAKVIDRLRLFIKTGVGDSCVKIDAAKNHDSLYFFGILCVRFIYRKKDADYISVEKRLYNGCLSYSQKLVPLGEENEEYRYDIKPFDDFAELDTLFACLYNFALDNPGGERFGCCSRYSECSDLKKCVHPDIGFSALCWYGYNLRSGRIFYGKNRNID